MPRIPDPIWWWLRAFPRRLYAVLFLAMQVLIAVLTTIHPLIVTVVAAQGGIIFLYANDHHLGMRDSERAAYFSGLGSVLPGYALVVHGWWWPLAVMWGGLGPVFLAERLMDWDYERRRQRYFQVRLYREANTRIHGAVITARSACGRLRRRRSARDGSAWFPSAPADEPVTLWCALPGVSEPGACVASELKGFFYVELHLRADGRWIGRQSTLWLPWLHVGVVDGARNRVPGALVVLRTEAGEIWYAQTGAYGVNLPLFNPAEGIAIFGAAPGAVASSALPLADQAAALAQGRPLLTSADMTIDENTGGTEILILQPDGELVAQRL